MGGAGGHTGGRTGKWEKENGDPSGHNHVDNVVYDVSDLEHPCFLGLTLQVWACGGGPAIAKP